VRIRASKINVFVLMTVIFLIISFIICLIPSAMSFNLLMLTAIIPSTLASVLVSLYFNFDIEITQDMVQIGGPSILQNRKKPLFDRNARRHFVDVEVVDIKRTNQRTFFERMIGAYKIYNMSGNGFIIYKYLFSKKKFENIKSQVKSILRISL